MTAISPTRRLKTVNSPAIIDTAAVWLEKDDDRADTHRPLFTVIFAAVVLLNMRGVRFFSRGAKVVTSTGDRHQLRQFLKRCRGISPLSAIGFTTNPIHRCASEAAQAIAQPDSALLSALALPALWKGLLYDRTRSTKRCHAPSRAAPTRFLTRSGARDDFCPLSVSMSRSRPRNFSPAASGLERIAPGEAHYLMSYCASMR